jgi:hypothetical protein
MHVFRKISLLCLLLLVLACQAPLLLERKPTPQAMATGDSPTSTPALRSPTPPAAAAPTQNFLAPIATPGATSLPTAASGDCAATPLTAALLQQTSAEQWLGWIGKLSGADPVVINGAETRITTRYSPAMFSANPNARAFEFVQETLKGWYPESSITVSDYTIQDDQGQEQTWKNLTLTLPGATLPGEIVILSAHLDSITGSDPNRLAPGAEDNASGAAALLEAARLFKERSFQRTIQLVWFTGEEEGLLGSRAFVADLADPTKITADVNLDMFGYDSDSDRCFELHVGELPQSDRIGQCFIRSLKVYDLGLQRYDYLTNQAIRASDHASFWDANIGAIEVVEDVIAQGQPGGCPASDKSPNYHTPQDTLDKLNPESGIMLVRAALATVSALAGPLEAH